MEIGIFPLYAKEHYYMYESKKPIECETRGELIRIYNDNETKFDNGMVFYFK